MNTTFDAAKDHTRGVSAVRHQMRGEQHRRAMRAALHDLQERLKQCHVDHGGGRVVGTASSVPSTELRMRSRLFENLRSFYTVFTCCNLLSLRTRRERHHMDNRSVAVD